MGKSHRASRKNERRARGAARKSANHIGMAVALTFAGAFGKKK